MGQSSPWKGYGNEGVLKEISGSICAISTLYMGYWRGFLYSNSSFKLPRTLYLAVRSLYLADFKECTTATETTTVLLVTQLLSSRLLRITFALVEGFVTRMWLPGSCFTAGCKPGREQNRYRWCGNIGGMHPPGHDWPSLLSDRDNSQLQSVYTQHFPLTWTKVLTYT